jgi:hypothetical protein
MRSVRDRYLTDAVFHQLVDTLHALISQAEFTPTEIREAAMLAQILYEERRGFTTNLDRDLQLKRLDDIRGATKPP